MGNRLQGKVAIVVGAGATPGETMGNGRATAIVFAREGAAVMLVDRDRDSAAETKRLIEQGGVKVGGEPVTGLDVPRERLAGALVQVGKRRFGRLTGR